MSHDHQPQFTPIGIDLDGTIDEAPRFFEWLSKTWPGRVLILTYRSDRAKAIRDLDRFAIHYDELVLVASFSEKAVVIEREGIEIYFDDQDEMTKDIHERTTVFKIRNGGNFDFKNRKWLYSEDTGRQV